ncbi:hypothetical protein V1477_004061 [Vespula maculifrons]|uniref:Uncharacterized protein n=1 Tax=Vespula maculifrons TaxID=7453 RepID=A0ABD2CQH3_VESMC
MFNLSSYIIFYDVIDYYDSSLCTRYARTCVHAYAYVSTFLSRIEGQLGRVRSHSLSFVRSHEVKTRNTTLPRCSLAFNTAFGSLNLVRKILERFSEIEERSSFETFFSRILSINRNDTTIWKSHFSSYVVICGYFLQLDFHNVSSGKRTTGINANFTFDDDEYLPSNSSRDVIVYLFQFLRCTCSKSRWCFVDTCLLGVERYHECLCHFSVEHSNNRNIYGQSLMNLCIGGPSYVYTFNKA